MDVICAFPGGIACRWFLMIGNIIDWKSIAGLKVIKLKSHNARIVSAHSVQYVCCT